MVFVAIEKLTGSIIEAKNVTYTDSVKRNYKYYCTCCNDEVTHVKIHKRNDTIVNSHFRHEKNSECSIDAIYEREYINQISIFVNNWLNKIKKEYLCALHEVGNDMIDVVNENGDEIYIKYSLVSKKCIQKRINREHDGKIIYLLAINNNYNVTEHSRKCFKYKINKTNDYLIRCKTKTDLTDYDLDKVQVYLDNGTNNIYQLVNNTEDAVYYNRKGFKVKGHLIKKIDVNNLTKTIIGDIWKKNYVYNVKEEKLPIIYTKTEIDKLLLIDEIKEKMIKLKYEEIIQKQKFFQIKYLYPD